MPLPHRPKTKSELMARAINAEAWEPPPGQVKLRCMKCEFYYASWDQWSELCHDCRIELELAAKRARKARKAAMDAMKQSEGSA